MGMFYGWIPPRSCKQPKRTFAFKPLQFNPGANNPRMEEYQAMKEQCPSLGTGIGNAPTPSGPRYEDPQFAAREQAARQVRHTVAPICNKGGYQLITNEADLKTVGRKV